jgi:hypothetical protein
VRHTVQPVYLPAGILSRLTSSLADGYADSFTLLDQLVSDRAWGTTGAWHLAKQEDGTHQQ